MSRSHFQFYHMQLPKDWIITQVMNWRSHSSLGVTLHPNFFYRFREMHHSRRWGRPSPQHPPFSLPLVSVLRLWSQASGSGLVSPPPAGPQRASLTRQHLRSRGQRQWAALRPARPRGRMLPGLFFNSPSDLQDAGQRRAVSGYKAEAPQCGNQIWEWFHLL